MTHRRRVVHIAAMIVLAVGIPTKAISQDAVTADVLRLAFYDYDATLPLNASIVELQESNAKSAESRIRYRLDYDSAHDQRVPAILAIPRKFSPPYPAVLLLAGSGGKKDTDYIRICSDVLSQLGIATLSIDAAHHGDRSRKGYTGDFHLISSPDNRNAWVQTVIDLRRAIDYLQSRLDIDHAHIGYMGFSQGGMAGGTLLGVEPRIAAAILVVAGGGLEEWSKKISLWKPEYAREITINASIVDPVNFVGRFAPRPLLMLAAKKDEMIPRFATDALFNAAREPKELVWMEGGHASPAALMSALPIIRSFFTKHILPPARAAAGR